MNSDSENELDVEFGSEFEHGSGSNSEPETGTGSHHDPEHNHEHERFIDPELEMIVEIEAEIGCSESESGMGYNAGRKNKTVKSTERVTTPYLTKYERARILGERALQISNGSPICVDYTNETDALRIAQKELLERKIPIVIRRYLPNGVYEDWKISELINAGES